MQQFNIRYDSMIDEKKFRILRGIMYLKVTEIVI